MLKEVFVPDLGNITNAAIIEIAVKPGDAINAEDTLITLESDKASMDIPSPFAGVVKTVAVKIGDKVEAGKVILTLESEEEQATAQAEQKAEASVAIKETKEKIEEKQFDVVSQAKETEEPIASASANPIAVHAGPAVRRLAREFGVDLSQVTPTGPKSRILKEDVQLFVKATLSRISKQNGGFNLPTLPIVDFSQFGEIEAKPLSRIKRLTATNLHRNWLLVPHVTQFEEADITELDAFRKNEQAQAEKQGIKLTPLAFIMKAVVTTLKAFPAFNASLDANGEQLILKKYFHIGVAVDTPEGLVVPVIRDVDKKNLLTLAKELAEVSAKAREKKLAPNDMQGSSFTISSLGGIGGTAFTPIVNLPDVAILGVSKSTIKPVYQQGQFVPRLMLPLSLSYDHRVIDGAEGARFIVHLAACLSDIRKWLL
jgi:pyruvate dehydrogenase E2 component (dihydrolipoamide acetyltransferase)